jgi:prephenate dehydrogenase
MTVPKRAGRVAIVGLGTLGRSLGLALQASTPDLEIVGHDREPDASREAQRSGAVHRTHWNLISAVEGASLVILALPVAECLATLKALKGNLAPGTVVTDTAPLKQPLVRWAAAEMSDGAHYVGGHPLARPAAPDGAAFARSTYCLTPTDDSLPAAVDAVVGMVESIGAQPAFLDPAEHDGLMWTLQGAPALAAAAALGRLGQGQAKVDVEWLAEAVPEEIVRLARLGESFLGGAALGADSEAGRRALGELDGALHQLMAELDGGSEAVAAAAERLRDQRERWLARHASSESPAPTGGAVNWRRILGLR